MTTPDHDPMRAYWKRLSPEEAQRQARQLLRRKGVGGGSRWRMVLLLLVMLALGAVAVIYLWAWISVLR